MDLRTSPACRRAFSLVEVLVSLTIIGLAGAALLLATESTTQSGNDAFATTVARGLAEQLLDEISGQRYVAVGESPTVLPFGPEPGEGTNPVKTILFDDTDDFHRLDFSPPVDPWGVPLGQGDGAGGLRAEDFRISPSFLAHWRISVELTYVSESDPSIDLVGTATSGMRAATVTVTRKIQDKTDILARMRRVFAHVPATSP